MAAKAVCQKGLSGMDKPFWIVLKDNADPLQCTF